MSVKAFLACIGLWYHPCTAMIATHHRAPSVAVSEIEPRYTLAIEPLANEKQTAEPTEQMVLNTMQQATIRGFSAQGMIARIAAGSFDDHLEVLLAQLALASYCNQRTSGEYIDTSKYDAMPRTMLMRYFYVYANIFGWQRYLVKNIRDCHIVLAKQSYCPCNDGATQVKAAYLQAKHTFDTLKKDQAKATLLYYCFFIAPIKRPEQQLALAQKMQKFSAKSIEEISIYFKALETLYVQYSCCDISNLKIFLEEFKEAADSLELYTQAPTYTQIIWDEFFCEKIQLIDELSYPCPEPQADAKILRETWNTCVALGEFLQDLGFYPCDLTSVTKPTKKDIEAALLINTQIFATLLEDRLLSFSLKESTASLWSLMRKLYAPSAHPPFIPFVIPINDTYPRVIFCPVPHDYLYVLPEHAKNNLRPSPHSLIIDPSSEPRRITPYSSCGSSCDLPGMVSTTAECSPPSKISSPSIIFEQSL